MNDELRSGNQMRVMQRSNVRSCVARPGMLHPRWRRALLLLAVLATGQGCYSYHAAELPSLVPPEEIRVELEQAEFRRVAPGASMVGPPRVEGRFSRLAQDSLVVSVWIGDAYRGTPFESTYQDISIPLAEILRVENRKLSRSRTALVAAGAVTLIAVLIDGIGFVDIFGGGGDDGPPVPPEGDPSRIAR